MSRLFPLVLLAAAACGTPPEPAPPPPVAAGTTLPSRQAVLATAYAFGDTRRLAGRPAEAARVSAQLEWMAVALPQDPWWTAAVPTLFFQLRDGRSEMRSTLGLAPDAAPGAVTQGLADAAAALDAGSRSGAVAALAPVAPAGGEAVLARLEALPPMPRAAVAASAAQQEMTRIMTADPE